ncbi:hypothetical protein AALO_G00288110 [Alosa alosa]|uniref:Zmp:0000001301 n=1 Tax=Alosa alosa TaxID=278164 RepID=A0AAV6FJE0_9TELE|nr:rab9 effector protein with kelch motifs [Alosa alosa]KAG5261767.1 hypothetical protein AALO_G00288110 [Alosa alosa]
MALASGHWLDKEVRGEPPSPRYGHALALAGNIAFLFGGATSSNSEDPTYLRDFHMLTVSPTYVTWEALPQSGAVPSAREGHSLCVVKGQVYLFGGISSPEAKECLPGVYRFDIVLLAWEKLSIGGVPLRTLNHSSVAVGDNIYVYGGLLDGVPIDNLMMFNTVSMLWTPVRTTGNIPSPRYNHTLAAVGEQIFLYGGCGEDECYYKDIYVLGTGSLEWQQWEVKGESPVSGAGQTLTAHRDKDIYLFGGKIMSPDGAVTASNEIYKLSIAKMKWKVPLYVGIPPARRFNLVTFILHSHMYVFGGKNEEQEFNDLKVMKLINPSERQPVMKEILSEFGLQGVSNGFAATKVPNVKYELNKSSISLTYERSDFTEPTGHRDFTAVRDEALDMIHKAFATLDEEAQRLDRGKAELVQAAEALQCEKEAYRIHHQKQEQELQEMLEKHRTQNEAWLRARAEENDKERKELCKLWEEVLHEQEKLKEEQSNIQKRSEHLLSIMQQFKGM